jgi:hypothetical protein
MCRTVVEHMVAQILGTEAKTADMDTGTTFVTLENLKNYTK